MGSRPSGSGSRAVNIDNREKRTPSTLTDQSSRTGIDATFGGEALAVLRRDLKYRRFSRCPNQELDEGMCWRLNALPRGYFVLAIQRESKCAGSLSYLTEGRHGRRLSKRNESLPVLIPQSQPYTPQTLEQGELSDGSELRMIPQHIWQPIARNPTAKVMDVVDTDVRREPAQDARQVIVGTAMQRSFVKTPGLVMGPGGVLELVLDIEQPNTDRGRQRRDRQMHQ